MLFVVNPLHPSCWTWPFPFVDRMWFGPFSKDYICPTTCDSGRRSKKAVSRPVVGHDIGGWQSPLWTFWRSSEKARCCFYHWMISRQGLRRGGTKRHIVGKLGKSRECRKTMLQEFLKISHDKDDDDDEQNLRKFGWHGTAGTSGRCEKVGKWEQQVIKK